ncbi:MAG TPA: hypothetical protein VMR86_01885 [Myxococcota bacterium]|nr:hypothetical protein [Myxococcota bacterium]
MKQATLAALAAALTFAVPSAWANYNVNAKLTCYDDGDGSKLLKLKLGNAALIARCLSVTISDPSVANYALTFDSDTRELHVIRRCDSLVMCDLSSQASCQTAGESGENINTNAACIYTLLDPTEDPVGQMACFEKEKYSLATNKYSFSTSCAGTLDIGEPCTLSFKSGKLFDESGACPTAK